MANIEVEVRGIITQEKYEELNKLFNQKGQFIDHKNRVLVCYPDPETGSLVENLKTDIRVRATNGIPEIIIKLGEWGKANESRRELSLVGQKGEFDKMIMMLAALGHKTGIIAVRKGKIYMYQDIEFSLVEVPDHSYYFEAEIMVKNHEEQKRATQKINELCRSLKLKPLTQKGFFNYINRLNSESNESFDFTDYHEGYFKERFDI